MSLVPGPELGTDGEPVADDAEKLPRSARSKIVRVIIRLTVTLAALLLIAVSTVGLLQHELAKVDQTILRATGHNDAVRTAMTDARSAVQRAVVAGDATARSDYDQAVQRASDHAAQLRVLHADNPALTAADADQQVRAQTWQRDHGEALLTRSLDGVRASPADQLAAETAFDQFLWFNAEVGSTLRDQQQTLVGGSIQLLRIALAVAVAVIIGGTFWTLRPALRALRWIGPPLEDLHATVRRLQRGELGARADPESGVLEIRAVSAAVNRLAAAHQRRQSHDAEEIRLAEAVREIGSVVSGTFDFETIITDSLGPIVANFSAAGIWLRAFETSTNRDPDDYGSVFPSRRSPLTLVVAVRRAAELAWARQTTVVIRRHGETDPDYLTEGEARAILTVPDVDGAETILIVPVGGGRTCVGYLALRRLPSQPAWSEQELAALRRVGGDIGRAILHAQVYDQERRLVARLQELDSAKTDFVSMVSHELRTPLASIIGHLEIVQGGDAGPIDEETRPFLAAIDRNATRLTSLIEDLLRLSRIEQRADRITSTRVDLTETTTSAVATYAETAGRKNITIAHDLVDHAPVVGDPTELEQVVTNLLGNAIKYSPADTTVSVRLEVVGTDDPDRNPELVLAVADQGIGIATDDQTKIFERFYRAGGSTGQSVPGTGLGLAITQLVVQRHGGTVRVESAVGCGSTFVVTLPADRASLSTPVAS